MTTKYTPRNGIMEFFDPEQDYERVLFLSPIQFYEEFLGTTIVDGTILWLAKDTHAGATEANIADQHGGIFGLGISSADAEQEAGLTTNDQLNFNLDKGPIVQFVIALHTLPTLLTEIYFGIGNNYVKGTLAAADQGPTVHAMFAFDGSGACTIHTDDASTDNDAVSTGTTLVADAYHCFMIDFSDITDVKFYIDGSRVASSTTFSMANGTNVMVQPYAIVYKSAGAGLGDLYIDAVRIGSNR